MKDLDEAVEELPLADDSNASHNPCLPWVFMTTTWRGGVMQTQRKIAVAEATGRVGRHVVDVLEADGHDVVPMSRSSGVNVVTGESMAEALAGVACIIDVASQPSPDQEAATAFFTAAAANLQEFGEQAGIEQIVVVSIIGIDQFTAGFLAAKVAHERAMLSGPIPVRILRAAQFHEFVPELVEWGRQGEVSYVPPMRTQLVAARTVAEALADLANGSGSARGSSGPPFPEIAGPREENLVDVARLLAARRGRPGASRGREQSGRPGPRPLRGRRSTARPGRHPRRPDLRGVAGLDVVTTLQDRVALVTGSSRGIGAAIATVFANEGARVVVHGRDADAVETVRNQIAVAGGEAMSCIADLTHYQEIEQMRERIEHVHGPVDILVANAGGSTSRPSPFEEISEEAWRTALDSNLTATFLTIKCFLPGMKERGRGTTITMSSAAARRPNPSSPIAYAAAKAGIELLTKDVAAQAGPDGVRVNCIAPETIMTETTTADPRARPGVAARDPPDPPLRHT
jgi:3-oxoacyl-[acyl-carrier protein] reductase